MRALLTIILSLSLLVQTTNAQKVVAIYKSLDPVIENIGGSDASLPKARRLYYESRNASAESMYLDLIEQGEMEIEDYLRLSHLLFQNARIGLAEEIYKEYVKVSGETNPSFEKLLKDVKEAGLPIPGQKRSLGTFRFPSADRNVLDELCVIEEQQFNKYQITTASLSKTTSENHRINGILLHSYTQIDDNKIVFSGMEEDTYELYTAIRKNGIWKKPKKLELGLIGHKIHPSYNPVNGILHFSAKVSAEQGFDIYSSFYSMNNDEFAKASNLGPNVNTPKDEICPTFFGNCLSIQTIATLFLEVVW